MKSFLIFLLTSLVHNYIYSQVELFYDSIAQIVTLPDGRIVTNAYSTNMKLKRSDDGIDSLITNRLCVVEDLKYYDSIPQKNLIIYNHNEDLLVIESLDILTKRFFFLKLEGDGGYDQFSSKIFNTTDGFYLTLYYEGYENGKKKLVGMDYRFLELSNDQDILYQYYNN